MFSQLIRNEIREKAIQIEKLGTLPVEIIDYAMDQKLFKLFVPTELGGKMLDLPDAVRVFQEASAIDGSFGWLVTIGSGGNMFVPNFKEQACEELFNPKEAVIAGSGHANGIAVKTENGYLVTGEWKYCSGANYASMFTANSKLDETDEMITCIFLPDQVEIIKDWDAFGLKGTGSHSIRVENAFIPTERTFDLMHQANEHIGLVHTFPFVQFSQSSFAAVCLGIGQSFFEESNRILTENKEWWSTGEINKYELIKELIKKELQRFNQIEKDFHLTLTALWEIHRQKETLNDAELINFSNVCKEVAATTLDCTNRLFRHFGMEAVMQSSHLNRIWRNLHTASQHTFLIP